MQVTASIKVAARMKVTAMQ
jgi:hypothetical protein